MTTMIKTDCKVKTIQNLLNEVRIHLSQGKVNDCDVDAEWIVAETLKLKSRAELYIERNQEISQENCNRVFELAAERVKGVPLQYLMGEVEFFSLKLKITSDCLIPRPETEILVEEAIHWFCQHRFCQHPKKMHRILDLGTGSGNIAIAIAKHVPNSRILAIDISEKALKVARENITFHDLSSQIETSQADFTKELFCSKPFDLVVSNPPYVAKEDWNDLPREVRFFEPRIALWGGEKGIEIIRKMMSNVSSLLSKEGLFLMEFGGNAQSDIVEEIILETRNFKNFEILKDLSGKDRIVKAIKK
ncbi:MAG: peptide chain release factor N(5)-glutamine methyltransferase [Chlamydiae bacterium]|nr:peptide chain release factor N(5)-glutamine methyltransferase [Chlamydiota bacterium]